MRFFVLSGSHRVESQSLKVAHYVKAALPQEIEGAEVTLFDLGGNPIPLWDEDSGGVPEELWAPVAKELKEADAIVVVTPEWSGMATPGVKNFLLNCAADEVGHKPGLIVTVSAGRGGAYPVAELRMSGAKNNRLNWIPEHVIVHHAESNLNHADSSKPLAKEDEAVRARLRYALRVLGAYGKAMRYIRSSGVIDHKTFRNGM